MIRPQASHPGDRVATAVPGESSPGRDLDRPSSDADVLSLVAHSLRSPLNAILGWSHVLKDRPPDPAALARAAETIVRNAEIQSRLLDEILDLSRILRGEVKFARHPVSLSSIVEDAAAEQRPLALAHDVNFQLETDAPGEEMTGDRHRLRQAVGSLFRNAIQASAGGRVVVRLTRIDPNIELVVEDTRNTLADLSRVIDSSVEGSGDFTIGLGFVRILTEANGGEMSVEHQNGEGVRFHLRFPLSAVGSESVAPDLPAMASVNPEEAAVLEGIRVLVVDDNEDARELLAAALQQFGARVATACSGAEGLHAIERLRPDVLVSDIAMPDEDGYTFIRRVRTLPADRGGRIPAVSLSAYAGPEHQARSFSAGFQLHVPKPVRPLELAAVLADLTKTS